MDVHPPKNGINRYWSIPMLCHCACPWLHWLHWLAIFGPSGPGEVEAERAEPSVVDQNCSRPASMALWRRWGRGILQQRGECQEDLPVQPAQPAQQVQQVQHSNTQLAQLSHSHHSHHSPASCESCAVCDAKADSPRAALATGATNSTNSTVSTGSTSSLGGLGGLGGLGLVERLQRKRGESKGGHDLLDDTDQGTDAAAAEAAEGTGTQASSCRGFYLSNLWEYMAVHWKILVEIVHGDDHCCFKIFPQKKKPLNLSSCRGGDDDV